MILYKWIINLSPHDYNANDDHNAFEQQDVKDPMHWDGKIDCNNSDDKMKYNGGNHVAEEDYKTDEDGEDTQTSHGEKRLSREIFLIGMATFLILIANWKEDCEIYFGLLVMYH